MTPKILICTVGGSPQPLIASITYHCPDRVIFVASKTSRLTIKHDIEAQLHVPLQDTQIITLEDEQNLLTSVKNMRIDIKKTLDDWQCHADYPLLADFTGGTKVMSAALVLSLVESNVRFTYVGGNTRTKDGLGIVTTGNETILPLDNPWDILALRELQTIAHSFAACQFDTVAKTAGILASKADTQKPYYTTLKNMGNAYGLWDIFQHKRALTELERTKRELAPYAIQQRLKNVYATITNNAAFLTTVCEDMQHIRGGKNLPPETGKAYILDILANAQRRATAGRYDDAVARLYSAIEKAAKIRLLAEYGINNSDIDCSKLPENLRAEFSAMVDDDGKIKIPLQRSYCLLAELGDSLGKRYIKHQAPLAQHLRNRNVSLLAHGYDPVEEKMYTSLFNIALEFLDISEDALPIFPILHRDDLII